MYRQLAYSSKQMGGFKSQFTAYIPLLNTPELHLSKICYLELLSNGCPRTYILIFLRNK